MDRFLIQGGKPLLGTVKVAGAKNAVLPILGACLLTEEPCTIRNVPQLEDVNTMLRLLRTMGVQVSRTGRTVRIQASDRIEKQAPYDIVRKMRASYYVLGPLVGRFGRALVSLPGGCAIGARPVDLHLRGLAALGARVDLQHGYVEARARQLRGATVLLEGPSGPSVGATANTMMAAVLARGETIIEGAACEPEVEDLAGFLTAMGARIEGAGTPEVRIRGVRCLSGAAYRPIPDRIEAGTYAVAAAITQGEVRVENCRPEHLSHVVAKLAEAGALVDTGGHWVRVKAGELVGVKVSTSAYPGFPTDLQAQFTAMLTIARGESIVTENVFPSRFLHAMELNRMGASVDVSGNMAVIHGVERLSSAQVMASDLRASAALVLAGLAAKGETEILRIYHIDRGYERLEQKLLSLGARIERVSD